MRNNKKSFKFNNFYTFKILIINFYLNNAIFYPNFLELNIHNF